MPQCVDEYINRRYWLSLHASFSRKGHTFGEKSLFRPHLLFLCVMGFCLYLILAAYSGSLDRFQLDPCYLAMSSLALRSSLLKALFLKAIWGLCLETFECYALSGLPLKSKPQGSWSLRLFVLHFLILYTVERFYEFFIYFSSFTRKGSAFTQKEKKKEKGKGGRKWRGRRHCMWWMRRDW